MITIVVPPINSQFVTVWVKIMVRNGHSLQELKLSPHKKGLTITDQNSLESLKTDFVNFRQSGLGMDEYFSHNIIVAKRSSEKFFIPRNQRLTFQRVSLVKK